MRTPCRSTAKSATGWARAIASRGLGNIALAGGDHEETQRRYEDSLPIFREADSRLGEANSIQRLGEIAQSKGDPATARARFGSALEIYQSLRQPYSIGFALYRLARLETEAAVRRALLVDAAREWMSIDREDLIEEYLTKQFPGEV